MASIPHAVFSISCIRQCAQNRQVERTGQQLWCVFGHFPCSGLYIAQTGEEVKGLVFANVRGLAPAAGWHPAPQILSTDTTVNWREPIRTFRFFSKLMR